MKIVKADLWNSEDDIILVTTNSTIKKNGEVVMGGGAALEMKNKFPNFPKILGYEIKKNYVSGGEYGVLVFFPDENLSKNKRLGAFQVKYNWWEKASLPLINYSTNLLYKAMTENFKDMTCSLNFPGIGNGKLDFEDVYYVVQRLPDNVTIYKKG